jgi:hypothetical protein
VEWTYKTPRVVLIESSQASRVAFPDILDTSELDTSELDTSELDTSELDTSGLDSRPLCITRPTIASAGVSLDAPHSRAARESQ